MIHFPITWWFNVIKILVLKFKFYLNLKKNIKYMQMVYGYGKRSWKEVVIY